MNEKTVLTRVDNRLIHGQIIQAWLPYLDVKELVVADDRAASEKSLIDLYGMTVPKGVDFLVTSIIGLAIWARNRKPDRNALVLVCDVFDAVQARMAGYRFGSLNIGNVHALPGRLPVSDGIFLSLPELEVLNTFTRQGIIVEVRKVPGDTAIVPPSPEEIG